MIRIPTLRQSAHTSRRDATGRVSDSAGTVLANATIDRIFNRAEICLFKGRSYRLKGKIEVKNIDLKVNTK